jgi:hypothetical protein
MESGFPSAPIKVMPSATEEKELLDLGKKNANHFHLFSDVCFTPTHEDIATIVYMIINLIVFFISPFLLLLQTITLPLRMRQNDLTHS